MKRLLLIKSKSICYNSTFYFTDCMADALHTLGVETHIFLLHENINELLDLCKASSYDAIVDFNSTLPSLTDSSGCPYLNQISIPFYNYLLDHPLYHHRMLNMHLTNSNAICLDLNHVSYIKEHYPHIQKVLFLPLAGMMASAHPSSASPNSSQKKDIPLLFTGTYTPLQKMDSLLEKANPNIRKEVYTLIEYMKNDASLTIEKAMANYIDELGVTVSPSQFANFLYAHFPADTYMSAYHRIEVLTSLLNAHIPVTVYGHGWSDFQCEGCTYLDIHPPVSYQDSLQLMRRAKITLNIMPEFKNGTHDRVYSSMLNQSVSLTDRTVFLNHELISGENALFYNLDNIPHLPDLVKEALNNPSTLKDIAQNGSILALKKHTWEKHMEVFLSSLSS